MKIIPESKSLGKWTGLGHGLTVAHDAVQSNRCRLNLSAVTYIFFEKHLFQGH